MQDISLEQAREMLTRVVEPLKRHERRLLEEAIGYILAEDIYADFDQPPFNRSPLDGYAIKAQDSTKATQDHPIKLKVIGEVCAGDVFSGEVGQNEAVRIMTGAPIPKGCDAVLRQEDTDYGEEKVAIYKALKPYSNYCFAGEDIKSGQLVIKKGEKLSAIHLGVLASLGKTEVKVYAKPKVGLICTGDELILPGETLRPGKIYNSNGMMLRGRAKELGIVIAYFNPCKDTPEEVSQLIARHHNEVDLWITTGGVSVGKKDILHHVINDLNAQRLFWRIQMQPGTPVLAFQYQQQLVISLSGNPFAALVNFELLVRPVLAKLQWDESLIPERKEAILQNAFEKISKKRRFIRATYKDGKVFLAHKNHSSGSLYTMSLCNCLIDIPGDSKVLEAGEKVNIVLL